MLEGTIVARARGLQRIRLGAIIAVALLAAFLAWLLVRSGDDAQSPAQGATAVTTPRLVSATRLLAVARTLDYPLYWASARAGMRYELTQAGNRTYIRYLPADVAAGDPRPHFLAIGTYSDPKAFAQTRTAGRRPGAVTISLPRGGIAVYSRKHPTSVYFSYPGSGVQVEVYAPSARTARRLVLTKRVAPIR